MEVYIEYAVLDNLIIDALIIMLVAITLHTKYRPLRVVLSLIQGVVFALCSPFITINTYLLTVIKVVYSLIIVLSLKRFSTIKDYIITYFAFISYTFMLGGVCYALLNVFNIPYNQNGIVLNGYALPISLIILLAFVYVFVGIKIIKYISTHHKMHISTYDIVITVNSKKYYFRGFLDSGNKLFDGSKPINVISFSCFCQMFKNFPFEKIIFDKVDNSTLSNAHYIDVTTANKTSKMLVFEAEELKICHDDIKITKTNVAIGVSKVNFGSFECLLNEALL